MIYAGGRVYDGVTLFCGVADPAVAAAGAASRGVRVEHEGLADGWETLRLVAATGTLTVRRKMFAPGGEFAGIVLGALTYLDAAAPSPAKERALSHLESSDMILGVRADPPLAVSDDPRDGAVHRLAVATEALLFDGVDLLDAGGAVLLRATAT